MEFKVGDKVKVIEKNSIVKVGAIGKVVEIEITGSFIDFSKYKKFVNDIYYDIIDHIYLSDSRLEKIKEQPKVYAWDTSAKKEQKKLEKLETEIQICKIVLGD